MRIDNSPPTGHQPVTMLSLNESSAIGTAGPKVDCAKECPCGVPAIPVPDQWLEVMVTGGFKVWHIMFIIIAFVVTLIVVYCCFHRCRIPRTKQEIEADLMRANLTTKFRDYLQELPSETIGFVEALKRVQEIEEKLAEDDALNRDLQGARKRMGWLKLNKGAKQDKAEEREGQQATDGATTTTPGTPEPAKQANNDENVIINMATDEANKEPTANQSRSKSTKETKKSNQVALLVSQEAAIAVSPKSDQVDTHEESHTKPETGDNPNQKVRRPRREKPNLARTKGSVRSAVQQQQQQHQHHHQSEPEMRPKPMETITSGPDLLVLEAHGHQVEAQAATLLIPPATSVPTLKVPTKAHTEPKERLAMDLPSPSDIKQDKLKKTRKIKVRVAGNGKPAEAKSSSRHKTQNVEVAQEREPTRLEMPEMSNTRRRTRREGSTSHRRK